MNKLGYFTSGAFVAVVLLVVTNFLGTEITPDQVFGKEKIEIKAAPPVIKIEAMQEDEANQIPLKLHIKAGEKMKLTINGQTEAVLIVETQEVD